MSVDEYKTRVIRLFKSGEATQEQWDEMAAAVLDASEMHGSMVAIDEAVYPEGSQISEPSSTSVNGGSKAAECACPCHSGGKCERYPTCRPVPSTPGEGSRRGL